VQEYDNLPHEEILADIRVALANKNMQSRVSIWPVLDARMYNHVSFEYAIKWINGEVPKEGVDIVVLKELMEECAGVEVYLTLFLDEDTGVTYSNILTILMDYVTF